MSLMRQEGKAPVVLFTYRKPDCLDRLYEAIRAYRPPRLYISHNAHRDESERKLVGRVRETVSGWSFPFPVVHLFHREHGLINDVFHSVLDEVFAAEERLIVLEDDTVPTPAFFRFCNHMLSRYRDDEEVGSIVGCNLGAASQEDAYFLVPFSIFHWGWASWSSRWALRRDTVIPWGNANDSVIAKLSGGRALFAPFMNKLDDRTTWDIKWGWTLALHDRKCVVPGVNLVANRGFVPHGSYVNFPDTTYGNLGVSEPVVERMRRVDDVALNAAYEDRSADLLGRILQARGELEFYSS